MSKVDVSAVQVLLCHHLQVLDIVRAFASATSVTSVGAAMSPRVALHVLLRVALLNGQTSATRERYCCCVTTERCCHGNRLTGCLFMTMAGQSGLVVVWRLFADGVGACITA